MKLRAWFLAICALLSTSGPYAQDLPDLGESSQADFSPQAERKLGESFMRDIRLRDPSYVDDPEIEGYLNELGGRLVAASPEARPDFVFFVVRDPTLNAFAMPGGFIGVHTGLITASQAESELASVLAHEIAHVTQRHIARMVAKQSQATLAAWAAMIVAILAARSNSQVSQAAVATGQAVAIQAQLNYSREFEREADRIGIQILEKANFDVHGMVSFFDRLQKFGRVYENNAPSYLRTHPLTTERIADMENRAQLKAYRQVPDSLAFQLVRAKIRAQQGTPGEAIAGFETQLKEKKYSSEAAARYGLARALLRANDPAGAEREVAALRALKAASPMVDMLAGDVRLAQGDPADVVRLLRDALGRHPHHKPLTYGLIEALLAAGDAAAALRTATAEIQLTPSDARLWGLQGKVYAVLGKRTNQHRSQAELYALNGQFSAAVEQLVLAQRAADGDFYEMSAADARLRELRVRQLEEAKQR